jgi:hypothetical protein
MKCHGLLLLAGLAASKAITDEPSSLRTDANQMKKTATRIISIMHDNLNLPSHCIGTSGKGLYWMSCDSQSARFQAPTEPLRPSLLKTKDGKLCMSIDPDSPSHAVILRPCQKGTYSNNKLRSHRRRQAEEPPRRISWKVIDWIRNLTGSTR